MSTAESTTVERLDMSEFEFDVPCEIKYGQSGPCSEKAEWIMRLRAHCTKGKAVIRLIGARCHERVVSGQTATCGACGDPTVVVLDHVETLERIKP